MLSPNAIVLIAGISILILSFVWVQTRRNHYEKNKRIPGSIGDMTLQELEALIRQVIHEELNRDQAVKSQLDEGTAMDSLAEDLSPPRENALHDPRT